MAGEYHGALAIGALRPNLFIYGHIIIFPFLVAAQVPLSRRVAEVILLCGAVALLWQARSQHSRQNFSRIADSLKYLGPGLEQNDLVIRDFSYGGHVGRQIAAGCATHKATIFEEGDITLPVEYYTKYDTAARQGAALLTSDCVRLVSIGVVFIHPGATLSELAGDLSQLPDAWFIYSHAGPEEAGVLKRIAGRYGRIADDRVFSAAGYFHLTRNQSAP